jgi:SAM-dependent methyltransferase
VTTWTERARDTALAFDGVAASYDRSNTANPILAAMRQRMHAALRRHVPPGARLLDLGCGPGTDHPALVAAGYQLTAIDSAPEMVREARHAAEGLEMGARPIVRCLSIDDLPGDFAPGSFEAAFSNFGPLNCVADLAAVARRLHSLLAPGGVVVASIIGRFCPWEIGLFAARGDLSRAFIRFRRGHVAVPLEGRVVWMRYYTAGECTRVFAREGFRRIELSALGLAAPPPYAEAFAQRHQQLAARLLAIDDVAGRWPMLRAMGDHFAIVLRRE